eukprot:14644-Heterococcus_DN1.PRE.4
MGHTRALSCCAASTDHCATADIGGRIIVWAVADKFAKVCEYSSDGHPVTSMAMRDTLLVAALSTGTIRIYRCDVVRAALSELLVEIGAHARAITAIDIHPVQWQACAKQHLNAMRNHRCYVPSAIEDGSTFLHDMRTTHHATLCISSIKPHDIMISSPPALLLTEQLATGAALTLNRVLLCCSDGITYR